MKHSECGGVPSILTKAEKLTVSISDQPWGLFLRLEVHRVLLPEPNFIRVWRVALHSEYSFSAQTTWEVELAYTYMSENIFCLLLCQV